MNFLSSSYVPLHEICVNVFKNILQGTMAFCSGGDQALRTSDGYADHDNFGRLNVLDLQVEALSK